MGLDLMLNSRDTSQQFCEQFLIHLIEELNSSDCASSTVILADIALLFNLSFDQVHDWSDNNRFNLFTLWDLALVQGWAMNFACQLSQDLPESDYGANAMNLVHIDSCFFIVMHLGSKQAKIVTNYALVWFFCFIECLSYINSVLLVIVIMCQLKLLFLVLLSALEKVDLELLTNSVFEDWKFPRESLLLGSCESQIKISISFLDQLTCPYSLLLHQKDISLFLGWVAVVICRFFRINAVSKHELEAFEDLVDRRAQVKMSQMVVVVVIKCEHFITIDDWSCCFKQDIQLLFEIFLLATSTHWLMSDKLIWKNVENFNEPACCVGMSWILEWVNKGYDFFVEAQFAFFKIVNTFTGLNLNERDVMHQVRIDELTQTWLAFSFFSLLYFHLHLSFLLASN